MSTDSQWAVQQSVFSRLAAHAPLTALLAQGAGSIFDVVTQDAPMPYAVLGEMESTELSTQQADGCDIVLSIHVLSRYRGFKELKNIMAEIRASLHNASFSVTGHTLVLCQFLSSSVTMESDGQTRRSIQKFRIITEPL